MTVSGTGKTLTPDANGNYRRNVRHLCVDRRDHRLFLLCVELPEACDETLYTYGGVPVRVARLAAGANRLAHLNAGLYLVKIGGAPAVPVWVR